MKDTGLITLDQFLDKINETERRRYSLPHRNPTPLDKLFKPDTPVYAYGVNPGNGIAILKMRGGHIGCRIVHRNYPPIDYGDDRAIKERITWRVALDLINTLKWREKEIGDVAQFCDRKVSESIEIHEQEVKINIRETYIGIIGRTEYKDVAYLTIRECNKKITASIDYGRHTYSISLESLAGKIVQDEAAPLAGTPATIIKGKRSRYGTIETICITEMSPLTIDKVLRDRIMVAAAAQKIIKSNKQ